MAAVPSHGLGDAKETFEVIRTSEEFPFVQNHGPELALLNNSKFPELVDYLYNACCWSKFKIDNNIRHYNVFDNHSFES
jgi:hypothetical protein